MTKIGKIVFRVRQFFYLPVGCLHGRHLEYRGHLRAPGQRVRPHIDALATALGLVRKLFNLGVDSELSTWGAAVRLVRRRVGRGIPVDTPWASGSP